MTNPMIQMPLRIAIGIAALGFATDAWANPVHPVPISQRQASQTRLASTIAQPKVELKLSADRQVVVREPNGQTKTTWQALGNQSAKVGQGDVIRFTLNGQNNGSAAARNVVLNQAIPQGTRYVLQSARLINNPGELQFSIDGGKSFSPAPMVKVKTGNQVIEQAAPADAYTHIRLGISQELRPKGTVRGEYQVTVK
jgi:uncharacterized repeat protein (TIGR01451 family)